MSTLFFLCALLAFIALVLTWLLRGSVGSAAGVPARPPLPPLVVDDTPDEPEGFGFKMCWLAIRSEEPLAVVEALGLEEVVPANWRSGVAVAYRYPEDRVFVTPPVAGWVLCAGRPVPALGPGDHPPAWRPLLEALGSRFPDVQLFGNHRVSSYTAWGRYQDGRLLRAYASADGDLLDEGERTPEEIELGFDFATPENPEAEPPGEEDVLRVAGAWSVDPGGLGESGLGPGVGWVGRWSAP